MKTINNTICGATIINSIQSVEITIESYVTLDYR